MGKLETVDLDGVEILREGGPYRGTGSKPEGDYFKADFLEALAEAAGKVSGLRPKVKIGHNTSQRLLKESGLADDEQPAAGYLANLRTAKREGRLSLLADLKAVPSKLADLVKAGAFPTRSVELGRLMLQEGENGKPGDKIVAVTALALLGAKRPAVRTLDDIAALYSDEGVDDVIEVYAEQGTVLPAIEADRLVITTEERLLAEPPDRKEDDPVKKNDNAADTSGMKIKADLPKEQLVKLAESFDIELEADGKERSEDDLREAVTAKLAETVEVETPKPTPDSHKKKDEDDQADDDESKKDEDEKVVTLSEADYAEMKATAELAKALAEKERSRDRELIVIEQGVNTGKIAPAKADEWRQMYDANPEVVKTAIATMPVNDELLKALGEDGEGDESATDEKLEEAQYAELAESLGITIEED